MSYNTEIKNLAGVTFELGDSIQHNDGSHCIIVSIKEPKFSCAMLGVVKCGTESFRWASMGNFTALNGVEINR